MESIYIEDMVFTALQPIEEMEETIFVAIESDGMAQAVACWAIGHWRLLERWIEMGGDDQAGLG